jgi:hypothetical protein
MSQPILVNGEIGRLPYVLRIVAWIGCLVGVALFAVDAVPAILVLVFAVPLLIGCEIYAWQQRSKRWQIVVTPQGFSVLDSRGKREFLDEQVKSLAYHVKNVYSNGELSGYVRQATLWLVNESQPLHLNNHMKTGQNDPVHEFLVRIIDLLKEGFEGALDHGLTLEGDGWKLSQHEFVHAQKRATLTTPISQIAAIDAFDQHMCLWIKGEAEPFTRFPLNGRNIWLLRLLLLPRLTQEATANQPPASGLGRILFQRKTPSELLLALYFFASLCMLAGIATWVFQLRNFDAAAWAALLCLAGSALATFAWMLSKSLFRAQEWGVYKTGLFGTRELKYLDVASFTYGATRHYHNGVYTGTHINMQFVPLPGVGKTISFGTSVQGDDSSLEELRDFVAKMIASRMLTEWSEGKSVAWTKNITFHKETIEYRPSGFVGRKASVHMPFANYGGWNMGDGFFYLFEQGTKNAVFSEAVSSANFFPGFFMLLQLFHNQNETENAASS